MSPVKLGDMMVQIGGTGNPLRGCTCTVVDATSIGDAQRTVLPVRDPACIHHGDHLAPVQDDDPEVECCRCGEVKELRTSTWEDHPDLSVRGWWCENCRVASGIDATTAMTYGSRGTGKTSFSSLAALQGMVGQIGVSKETLLERLELGTGSSPEAGSDG